MLRPHTFVVALAALALGASLSFATPGVTVQEIPNGVRIVLDGDWADHTYMVWRSDAALGVYVPLLAQAALCTGECYAADTAVVPGETLWYRFDVFGRDGSLSQFGPFEVVIPDHPLGLRASPNPGAGATTLVLSIPGASRLGPVPVTVRLYDLQGRAVRTIFDGPAPRGASAVAWDGRGASGAALDAGLYFARLTSPQGASTLRLLRIR